MIRRVLIACVAASAIVTAQPASPVIGQARISPNGQWVAFVRQGRVGGDPVGLFKIPFTGQNEVQVAPADGRVSEIRWSPAGERIAYLSSTAGAPARLRVVSAGGGTPRTIDTPGRAVIAFQWSSDGRRLLYESAPQKDAKGARELNVAVLTPGDASAAPFPPLPRVVTASEPIVPVPDAKVIFITPLSEDQQALTLSNGKETWIDLATASGTRITVMPPGIARILEPPSWSADGTRFTVVAAPGDGPPEIYGGSLPMAQSNRPDFAGAVPPMVRQLTGTPR